MLRTRAPVVSGASSLLPLDLHVLGLSLAFILSQDQTLHCNIMFCFFLVPELERDLLFLRIDLLFPFLLHYIQYVIEITLVLHCFSGVPFGKRVQSNGVYLNFPNVCHKNFEGVAAYRRELL